MKLSYLVGENNRGRLSEGRKGMQRSRATEEMKKFHTGAKEVCRHGVCSFVCVDGNERREVGSTRDKFPGTERKAE